MDLNDYLSLAEVTKRCPGRPSTNAVWRWCRKGVQSRSGETIRLKHIRIGGKIYTTQTDLEQFFHDVAESDRTHFDAPPPRLQDQVVQHSRTDRQRQCDVERAEAELKAAGF